MLRIKMLLDSAIVAVVMVMPVTKPVWAQVADLRITEVNYNPPGSDANFEHFELTNFGDAVYTGDCDTNDFDPDTGLFFDDEADRFVEGAGSHILCLQEGQFTINPGESVIFARRRSNFIAQFDPPESCQVFDYSSSVSLNNNGDFITVLERRCTIEFH